MLLNVWSQDALVSALVTSTFNHGHVKRVSRLRRREKRIFSNETFESGVVALASKYAYAPVQPKMISEWKQPKRSSPFFKLTISPFLNLGGSHETIILVLDDGIALMLCGDDGTENAKFQLKLFSASCTKSGRI